MSKEILPIPTLPFKQTFGQRFGRNFAPYIYFALGIGLFATIVAYILTNPINFVFLLKVDIFYTLAFMIMGTLLALLSPAHISPQETEYRQRLILAARYFVNEEQIKFDLESLSDAMEQLEKDLSPEQFSKLKDMEIIDYVVDQARSE